MAWLISQSDCQSLCLDCYYDPPLIDAAKRFYLSDEWTETKKFLPSNIGTALDVGAGMGIGSFALASEGWQVTSLEPDPSNLVGAGAIRQLAVDSGLDIYVVEKWGERLPFKDNSFDVVYLRQVLHHAQNLQLMCKELYRVLKPGGRLIASREHVISNNLQLHKFLYNHPLHRLYGGENAFKKNQYIQALKSAGFIVKNTFGPWGSLINIAPLSRSDLSNIFIERFHIKLGGSLMNKFICSNFGFRLLCVILGLVDRRPGRLYTFILDKNCN